MIVSFSLSLASSFKWLCNLFIYGILYFKNIFKCFVTLPLSEPVFMTLNLYILKDYFVLWCTDVVGWDM